MLKGIDVSQRINFISKEDKSEPKTIFVLKPLSGIDSLNVGTESLEGKSNNVLFLITTSIVEIKNFKGNKEKKDIVSSLPLTVLNELLEKINEINNISEKERKN